MRLLSLLLFSRYKKLDLSVTNICNSRCKTCFIWQVYQNRPQALKKEIGTKEYREFFRKNQLDQITFTGGEPLLKKDILEIIFAALEESKKPPFINIVTNAIAKELVLVKVKEILTHPRLEKLHVAISLDGTEKVHDLIKGIKGNYQSARETFAALKTLKNKKLSLHYSYTISKYNQGKMEEFLNETKISPNDIVLCFALKSPRYASGYKSVGYLPRSDMVRNDVKIFLKRYKIRSLNDLGQWVFLRFFLKNERIPCVAGKNTFHLNPYGKFTECALSEKVVGNIKKGIRERQPPKNCFCYTPCESYFGLLSLGPIAILKAA